MRHVKVSVVALSVLLLATAPFALGDNKPSIGGIPDPVGSCYECSINRYLGIVSCDSDVAGSWKDCSGGWIVLCDGSGTCVAEPNCGKQRCLWA
jgi:hypothetical protein